MLNLKMEMFAAREKKGRENETHGVTNRSFDRVKINNRIRSAPRLLSNILLPEGSIHSIVSINVSKCI